MTFSKEVARKAFHGSDIKYNPVLHGSGDLLTQEHCDAINSVARNYDEFCDLIRNELYRLPLTNHYFQKLIEARLHQDLILTSRVIASFLYDDNPTEARLRRIQGKVGNLDSLTEGVGIPKDENEGQEADEKLLDIWSEIFVMDFILHNPKLEFTNVERVVRPKGQPQVDLVAEHQGNHYAIEITRIRKRDFWGSTLPNGFDAIYRLENLDSLRRGLRNKLKDKNRQMERFCAAETTTFDKRLLIIKTSQEEYQDGSEVVRDETRTLFKSGDCPALDEVMLIYDIKNFDWLR